VVKTEHRPLHEYLRQHARSKPERPAIVYYGATLSYGQLDDLSDRFANYLAVQGIGKGDRVALFMQNCPQYYICHYGVQKVGAAVGPCNPMFKERELEHQVNDLGAKILVALDSLAPVVENALPDLDVEHVVTTSYADFLPETPVPNFPDSPRSEHALSDSVDLVDVVREHPPDPPEVEIDLEEDVALIAYTSGTTGLPKGALLTYHNAEFSTRVLADTYSYRSDDVFLAVLPLFHVAGMIFGVNSPIYCGATAVLLNRFTPEAFMGVVERYRVSVAYTVTPMIAEVIEHPTAKKTDFRSLRLNSCTSFGMQLSEELSERWREITRVGVFELGYGLSETHGADVLMPPERVKFGTVGIPTRGTQMKIVDPENPKVQMPVGEHGEICIKNAGVFKGYLNKPEATREMLRGGFVHTGDIGRFDEEGYLYLLGRNKEMIKCSGYSVFPDEVELLLLNHPAVAEAAVVGVPDPVRGESVKAFVVVQPEYEGKISADEIISWSQQHMAAYKYPRHVEFRDSLLRSNTGKLLRRLLAQEVEMS